MCEACGPVDGKPEQIRPELMAELHKRNEAEAKRRGITMDEFLDADRLVSPWNRFLAWLDKANLNIQFYKPGL
jgi:hypothetical protein